MNLCVSVSLWPIPVLVVAEGHARSEFHTSRPVGRKRRRGDAFLALRARTLRCLLESSPCTRPSAFASSPADVELLGARLPSFRGEPSPRLSRASLFLFFGPLSLLYAAYRGKSSTFFGALRANSRRSSVRKRNLLPTRSGWRVPFFTRP